TGPDVRPRSSSHSDHGGTGPDVRTRTRVPLARFLFDPPLMAFGAKDVTSLMAHTPKHPWREYPAQARSDESGTPTLADFIPSGRFVRQEAPLRESITLTRAVRLAAGSDVSYRILRTKELMNKRKGSLLKK